MIVFVVFCGGCDDGLCLWCYMVMVLSSGFYLIGAKRRLRIPE